MSNVQKRKTEMVGSLVVPTDMMSRESAATPQSSRNVVSSAVEHFGEDLKRSVNLQKRKTEMYGTLIVNAMDDATSTSNSPGTSSPGRKTRKWNEPMDDVSPLKFRILCLRMYS